jgi:hypothetical protein
VAREIHLREDQRDFSCMVVEIVQSLFAAGGFHNPEACFLQQRGSQSLEFLIALDDQCNAGASSLLCHPAGFLCPVRVGMLSEEVTCGLFTKPVTGAVHASNSPPLRPKPP